MKTGNGKIANLPAEIRDELNYRLTEGEEGIELVKWLNSKPEVAQVIREGFDGTPISEQNLSEWRKHGYQKWLAYHSIVDETNELSDNAPGLSETGIDCDKLILTLVASYAEMIQCWIITPREEMTYKLAVYKKLTAGVLALQRAELQKIRVEIERERLELLREKRQNKSASSSSSRVSASTDTASAESAASDAPALQSPPIPRAQGPEPAEGVPDPASPPPAPCPPPPANAPASEQSDSASSSRDCGINELRHSPPPAQPGLKPLLIHGIPVVGFDGKQVMTRNGVRIGSSTRRAPQPASGTATQASSRVPMGPPLSKIPSPRSIPPRPAPKP